LKGERIDNSAYEIFMKQEEYCKVLCRKKLGKKDADKFKKMVQRGYHHNW